MQYQINDRKAKEHLNPKSTMHHLSIGKPELRFKTLKSPKQARTAWRKPSRRQATLGDKCPWTRNRGSSPGGHTACRQETHQNSEKKCRNTTQFKLY